MEATLKPDCVVYAEAVESTNARLMCVECERRPRTVDMCGRPIDRCLVCDETRNKCRGDARGDC